MSMARKKDTNLTTIEGGLAITSVATESREADINIISVINARLEASLKATLKELVKMGEQLAILKSQLIKNEGQKDRIGWRAAFENNMLSVSRRQADMLIEIHAFFEVGNNVPQSQLPTSWGTLYDIALAFKDKPQLLEQSIKKGTITAKSTRAQVKDVTVALKLRQPGASRPAKVTKESPMEARIAAVFDFMETLGVKLEDINDYFGD